MSLLPLFQWCEASTVGNAIRTSPWAFAVIESIHLLGLAAIGGAVLVVDLRLLGMGLRKQAVRDLAAEIHPWLVASLTLMLATGAALFMSESIKCYYSTPFRVKMLSLALAILFTFTVRRKVAMAEPEPARPGRQRVVAVVSLALWFCVAASGRWIGFSG
jgi:Family of unknown function (DUF6644)